ncbi:MAG: EscU/YscU/HrcU family type III secretion system export apparatus switch protein [Thioalkalispiraceae bacterium]|jgi:flagellar biosynthesis protein
MNDFQQQRTVTLAVALHYDEVNAPVVSAKGQDEIAQKIYEIAKHHNVPLQENQELVKLLSKIELGEQIPEALYLAVAEIIAFAYYLKGKVPKQT